MADVRAKLKTCLQGQRQLRHPELARALLQTDDAFRDARPWRKLSTCVTDRSLPIAFFRHDAARFFCGSQIAARYLSSGTTATQRAVSLFSPEGVLFYKMAVISTFATVLDGYWGRDSDCAQGASLLDHSCADSSLATMLRWLGEFWPLPRVSVAGLPQFVANLDPERPFFLWATSRQLLQLLCEGALLALPPRAIVIETGGWKNLRFGIRDEKLFHRRLLRLFGITEDRLCSEYGMCELAAQAWRCGLRNRFSFPVWVQVLVSRDGSDVRRRGTGRLCVYDPLRVDYPWLLCTEDLVSTAGQGLLRLRGRVPHTPVRGCALDVRLDTSPTSKSPLTRSYRKMLSSSSRQQSVQACKNFLSSRSYVARLGAELGSPHVARDALRDVLRAFPADLESALARSLPQRQLRSWLFVLPATHSLVGVYPLIFATLLRLRVLVKLPPNLDCLRRFIDFLNIRLEAGIEITTVAHTDLCIPSDTEALLCYGSDESLANLRASTSLPLAGFGTHDTVTVASLDHLLKFPQAHSRDVFHLSRRGCLSSKVLFIVPQPEQKITSSLIKILEENFHVFYGARLNSTCRAQAEAERIRYVRNLGAVFCSTACPAFPILPIDNLDFELALPRADFVLPLVVVRDVQKLKNLLRHRRSIKTIVQQGSHAERRYRHGRCFVRPGQAGRSLWDGTHEGQPLFAAHAEIAPHIVATAQQHATPPP